MADHLLEQRRGNVSILTLNVPERRNALSPDLRARLYEALVAADEDPQVRALVLTGAGGHFSAGGDIGSMDVTRLAEGRTRMRRSHRLIRQLCSMGTPVVAAVEGWAAAGGLGVALACDSLVCSEAARFSANFGAVALLPDLGILHTLPRRVGVARARQLLLYGEPIEASEALRIGLVDQLAAPGQALEVALARAEALTHRAPLPLALTKALLAEGLEALLERECELQSQLFLSADHAEGKAAFLAKRPANFTGA
ncbi:enoyl-CoA hydratase/isomerase family protein [Pseudomonas typographi]|uniref:Enoyl-CoA hydratase/isomerase family protein n=1 Tax=Pseudomonas typographi TaxID=2715964 RepID=A0ABR7Z1I6_9PSED|nr:enoyl-CoA hydratase-related protein [Pseudomonas typographi]MBD1551463.1 enoyl-CoA hydratase/isomerase family protein [Pseudomonas typographi]MBD1587551.1 enoyl-CoA hydratase/isomerase family protein [Pseudomonas typographi]MBD1599366.1 enoyl-CoA hydratase/isomerase family protein [Pseudomonas typographi]